MKKFGTTGLCVVLSALTLAGCATVPTGPTVGVMPAPGKPFNQFAAEENECRQYASNSLGTNPNNVATNNMVGSMAVGTAIGAVAGALVGGHRGAGVGAASGLVVGTAVGANEANYGAHDAQWRYNLAYEQCMYAKGNQVPSYRPPARYYSPPPPPPGYGAPPPPPPGY